MQQVNVRRCRPLISTDKSLNQADNKTRRYFRYSVLFCLLNRRTSCVAINIAIRSAKIRRRFELKMWPIRSEGPSEAPPPSINYARYVQQVREGGCPIFASAASQIPFPGQGFPSQGTLFAKPFLQRPVLSLV